ncbi:MAG TPA: lytic murein transglycosylase B [Casimicrobiaceae bacterium]|jgi:membrane-bound lytic murein transglycosylase B|nr:lytic murein transglycosylase B [Casimicrobiaceae bacterium]
MRILLLPARLAAALTAVLAIVTALPAVAGSRTHAAAASAQAGSGYERRPEVRAFIDALVRDDGFSRATLTRWFRDVRYQPTIVEAMDRPIAAPPKWFEYAPQFLSPERIEGGVDFWRAHADALARAERQFGVPPEIIVAIVGVETFYGRNVGRYRVIDALSTLAFDYPRRASFFRGELRHFLLLARDERFSPLVPKGSFAGAFGVPQFMPGSVREYAIDYDGDGRIDLWRSADDAVGSIANYLARHDWLRGQPVWTKAVVAPSQRDATLRRLDGGISERRPLSAWNDDGVAAERLPDSLSSEPVGVLSLEVADADADGDGQALRIVFPNFYVITRYNKSRLYAAAVASLAEAVRIQYDATATASVRR